MNACKACACQYRFFRFSSCLPFVVSSYRGDNFFNLMFFGVLLHEKIPYTYVSFYIGKTGIWVLLSLNSQYQAT